MRNFEERIDRSRTGTKSLDLHLKRERTDASQRAMAIVTMSYI